MESRKNGESAVEKSPPMPGIKKGAAKAPSGSGNGGAAAVLPPAADTAAAAAAKAAADQEAWDRFVEFRGYSMLG